MAETVGQHSVAAFTSPVNGTTPIDANTVRGNDNTVRAAYVDHDADPGIHVQSSSLASRPVAGTAGRKWITVNSGRYQLWYDDGSRWHEVASDAVNVDCLADANLTKGDVVKITGFNNGQNLPTVNKVTASTDTAFGVVENTVTSGNLVQIVNTGLIEDVDTNGYAVGTILYPNTSGGWTSTKPTSGNYQPAGYVLRGNTNNGVLYVEFSAPRIVERSDNTASTIVLRDASGNFAAGTITAGALTSTGLVTFASLKGTGATTVTNILDEDNMASDSATALATQQSIKAYVDAKVATVDTLAEVLVNGNTTGARDIIVTAGQKITTDTIAETTAAAGVTIDSVLLKDNAVTATTFNGTLNGAAPAGSLSGTTLASNVTASSLTSVGTLANLTVTNPITGSVTGSSGSTTGNAATATALQTARNINGVSFNGTADITVTAAAGTLTGTTLASGVTASSLTSVGTLSSLAVSGDLTVDTDTLKVDSTNNRVGIGTATPSYRTDISNGGGSAAALRVLGNDQSNVRLRIENSGSGGRAFELTGGLTGANNSDFTLYDATAAATRLSVDASGNLAVDTNTLYVDAANNRVGVGTASPGYVLDAQATSSPTIQVRNTTASTGNFAEMRLTVANTFSGTGSAYLRAVSTNGGNSTTDLAFGVNASGGGAASEAMRLDASGNLGLGLGSTAIAFENGGGQVIYNSTVPRLALRNSTTGTTGFDGTDLAVVNSDCYLFNRESGAVIFGTNGSERARIDSAGNLGLGVTPSAWGSGTKALEIGPGTALYNPASNSQTWLMNNAYYDGGSFRYRNSDSASYYRMIGAEHRWHTAPSGTAGNAISFTQAMTLDASGNLGVGATSPLKKLDVRGAQVLGSGATLNAVIGRALAPTGSQGLIITASVNRDESATVSGVTSFADNSSSGATIVLNGNAADQYGGSVSLIAYGSGADGNLITFSNRSGAGTTTERARITSGGVLLVGKAASNIANNGSEFNQSGACQFTTAAEPVMYVNRQTDDGDLIRFFQASTQEGSISVSGATVSYNAFAGSHWSQLEDGSKPEILRGTVMEAINELCGWPDETNERLPKAKVSDTAGSKKVYGVFMDWDNDWTETNDMLITSVGAFICRVAADVVVEQGDLLESNGDGTARVQADDVIRSSTIGKVTSTVKTHEYEDGTYCVPTVLYCG